LGTIECAGIATPQNSMNPGLLAPFLLLLALTLLALAEFMGASAGSGLWPWVKAGAEAAAVDINGTVVGALVGLGFYVLHRWWVG
jgi:hypothetical protein